MEREDGPGRIHSEHPFVPPVELREPARRLRGRLTAPVTLWTAGEGARRAGLTMSSVLVVEGEPPGVLGLVGETTDLWEAIRREERFVVHVLEEGHRELADRFAGVRPAPGGPFRGLEVEDGPWGPVIRELATRAHCRLEEAREVGFHLLVYGAVERIELHDLRHPLLYHRGRYRRLEGEER